VGADGPVAQCVGPWAVAPRIAAATTFPDPTRPNPARPSYRTTTPKNALRLTPRPDLSELWWFC